MPKSRRVAPTRLAASNSVATVAGPSPVPAPPEQPPSREVYDRLAATVPSLAAKWVERFGPVETWDAQRTAGGAS